MKTLLIILSLLLSSLLASTELSWVDEQVQAIKPARDGMHKREFSQIKDPFIFLKKNRGDEDEEKKEMPNNKQITSIVKPHNIITKTITSSHTNSFKKGLTLEAVLNKSVMINGIWYKLRENVRGYTISDINRNSVLLTKNKKSLLLTTKTRNTKIKFQK